MKRVLSIAGSDSGGGAGIQADLKTCTVLGAYGASVITALTAQNTLGVSSVFAVEPEFVQKQIQMVLDDIGADAIKIGMLLNEPIIRAVAQMLRLYPNIPIILDPVMVSQSGHVLLETNSIGALREYLFPLAYLITPNLDEAHLLCPQQESVETMAVSLLSMGPRAVLVKGGHRNQKLCTEAQDYLLDAHQESTYFSAPWVQTNNAHGTGCTLSAAIAVYVAQGFDLKNAISEAKAYLTAALNHSVQYSIGKGAGPVCHAWSIL